MRNRFDQLAKQIGQETLGPSGTTVAHDEISPEAKHADLRHEPDPAHDAERARLGLLGRIAAVLCLLEVYGHAPDAEAFRACPASASATRVPGSPASTSSPERGEHEKDLNGAPELATTSRALRAAAGAGWPERGAGRTRGNGA